jgi:chemotaxis protein methyltransferase WspC
LAAAIRPLVRFTHGNLLAPFFRTGEKPFDLIFCRNLLIYLHAAARRRVVDTLDRLLARQGFLCMGHAEPLSLLEGRFERIGPEGTFLYRRPAPKVADPQPVVGAPVRRSPAPLSEAGPQATPPLSVDLLAQARKQADAGHIDDALTICRTHLRCGGPSPDLLSLMGVLHQARQEKAEAAQCFQPALYLEPAHRESLTHWMLLCQEQGDHRQAERLRRRLARGASEGEA